MKARQMMKFIWVSCAAIGWEFDIVLNAYKFINKLYFSVKKMNLLVGEYYD